MWGTLAFKFLPTIDSAEKMFFVCRCPFRVGAGAEFEHIQSLALSVLADALGIEAVEKPVQNINEGKYKAEQRGQHRDLGKPLSGACCREEPGGEHAPKAAQRVH